MGIFSRTPRHLSAKGAEFIAAFEGFRTEPYNDAVDCATIGYGHLIHRGPVTAADRAHWGSITHDAAIKLLQADAEIASSWVYSACRPHLSNQARFDALVSLAFNVGTGALQTSTLLRLINENKRTAAGDEFLKWDMAGGQHLAGLARRRVAERRLWLTGRYS